MVRSKGIARLGEGGGENACQDDMGHFFVHANWALSCFLGGQDASQDGL